MMSTDVRPVSVKPGAGLLRVRGGSVPSILYLIGAAVVVILVLRLLGLV